MVSDEDPSSAQERKETKKRCSLVHVSSEFFILFHDQFYIIVHFVFISANVQ